jgi:hypothetical protein
MFIVIAVAIVSALFILELITLDIAKDVVFKSIFVILIMAISALIITALMEKPKKVR